MTIRIGTAGWSIAAALRGRFAAEGTALERYAGVFDAVEINSSFHRPHRPETWQRWAASVPDGFRFSVKLPKEITHVRKLVDCAEPLDRFAEEVAGLSDRLAVLLVQLPPKLAFDAAVARGFFEALRARTSAGLACEPRHAEWFGEEADALLVESGVARVAADPPVGSQAAARPGGARTLSYWRLHGSPVVYRSSYADRIGNYATLLRADGAPQVWCMFDNTASSAATADALALSDLLQR
ncbi:DUF72 domain-containing protein [Sphingomonas mesophila]|uniref:DUF72 domain-containing protein n=1 Tax=Sphingomonas mesophila TaxID=2303576 RepID=UPI000E58FC26|nr:DUF72 domain-containing protein [Sphingomonas mesophila]